MAINCNIKQIVELLQLKPNFSSQDELRFGSKGSLCVNLKQNTWFDFEKHAGGGMLDFIVHHGIASHRPLSSRRLCRSSRNGQRSAPSSQMA